MSDPVLADMFRRSQALLDLAKEKGATLGVVESCTGGLLGAALTAPPGSSTVFHGGFLTYSNALKQSLVGVSADTLQRYGAVSEQTALEMAAGGRDRLDVDYAISITGIAGPSGGSLEKPVGTVWFGLASDRGVTAQMKPFGDLPRNRVRDQAVLHALTMLNEAVHQT
ncbi:CinA family protein [uncultured Algimonas sp.]|uniref:CinA family protein n=1 Tax=uncultured Algimonas sp. TaxID=1547920 RepID=UPI0026082B2E|nr:CinA family protein [uncultured Algimonas sp.]